MDITYHLVLIVLMGVFFFLDKYSTSFNPMFFVIIFSIFGFILLQSSNIEYVDYSQVNKINSSSWGFPTTELNSLGVGIFTVESFILLVYWFFMILAVLNFMIGKKESNIRK